VGELAADVSDTVVKLPGKVVLAVRKLDGEVLVASVTVKQR
jgi:hypothetical protein